MRVAFVSEAPFTPSSMGKVVLYLMAGLAELGFDVVSVPYSAYSIPTPTSMSWFYNPREWAEADGDDLAELYPDVDIRMVPWGKAYGLADALSRAGKVDAAVFYTYPYLETDLNDAAFKLLTSRGAAALVYAIHEGPHLPPNAALSVVSYSRVVAPTRDILDKYLSGLRAAASEKGLDVPEEVWSRFSVVPHPVNTALYSPSTASKIPETHGEEERCDAVVGMLAKNNARKDYLLLLETAVRVGLDTGREVCAGLYMVNSVSDRYWDAQLLVTAVSARLNTPQSKVSKAVLMLPESWSNAGLTERMVLTVYSRLMTVHAFLTRGEAFGLPPLETALLGRDTATTAIPPQLEILGGHVPAIRADVAPVDRGFLLYRPDPASAYEVVRTCVESGCPPSGRDGLASRFDYRAVARALAGEVEEAVRDPRPISRLADFL